MISVARKAELHQKVEAYNELSRTTEVATLRYSHVLLV